MKLLRTALAFLPLSLLLAFTPSVVEKGILLPATGRSVSISMNDTRVADNYNAWKLASSGLSYAAFEQGMKGYNFFLQHHMLARTNLLTIIDYSQPSSHKRLYVLDVNTGKLLYRTLVAHGRNSGYNYATEFSNDESSHMSSLGFYITLGTYTGTNGYSLKLKGCEKGINDHALDRAIVFHGAEYVSESFIRNNGYLGRSYGCPAVPVTWHKRIIDKIKNGSCMFLYYPAKNYLAHSTILDS